MLFKNKQPIVIHKVKHDLTFAYIDYITITLE